jgi:5-oxopent-3-ene-1,2,5-tricarboxylate decarboxylase/2-hydroxyhepta-2,4-diene-1,7-dioate isomerase
MSLAPGDLLLVGVPAQAPRARAGQRMWVAADGLGRLENPLMAEREAT